MSADQRREAARTAAGKFGEQVRSDPEVSLGAVVAAENSELQEATRVWGINADEVDGLEEAWAERFRVLDTPEPESSAQAAVDILSLSDKHEDWNRIDVAHSANGHLIVTVSDPDRDEDGEVNWDSDAEATYVVTDDADVERLNAGLRNDQLRSERSRLDRDRGRYMSGELPVWNLLADPEELKQAQQDRHTMTRSVSLNKMNAERADEYTAQMSQLQELVAQGAMTQADKRPYWERRIKPASGSEHRAIRFLDAHETLHNAARADAKLDVMQRSMEEARALPEGPLKEFLVGERAERSYPATEGKGRNKRTVTKKYTPQSELVSDYDSAVKAHEWRSRDAAELTAQLTAMTAEHSAHKQAYSEVAGRVAELDEAAFKMGLPEHLSDVPRHPTRPASDDVRG